MACLAPRLGHQVLIETGASPARAPLDEYRASLHDCLDGLSEDEARMGLVPPNTTLLGLVKHVSFVEGVWFDQAVTGRAPTQRSASRQPPSGPSPSASRTPSRACRPSIDVVANALAERWPHWSSTTRSTARERGPSGHSSFRCCENLLNTPDTPTS
ncbi:MAG: DUF664 domain-containing protein [Acidimicrobiia bacterium]